MSQSSDKPDTKPEMKLDTSNLKSSYCNVCSATSTREEVVLTFGVNQNWDLQQQGGAMEVQLLHRIIMSPVAAKRFHDLLTRLVNEHQQRHGGL
ncbi:DUF3467 domain-containing protein [Falsiroseomonas oryzae]|uniref:DUF3467 domain-containing protein n=1 Tax=Falsiroseomonas oryzae TaxID=2766473 RepID=UPI0022EAB0EF|nr:DUF3467 domain-containing protein [Roseomonas sp. MO-31]